MEPPRDFVERSPPVAAGAGRSAINRCRLLQDRELARHHVAAHCDLRPTSTLLLAPSLIESAILSPIKAASHSRLVAWA